MPRLLLIGHDYLTAGGIEERFAQRGYDIERFQVIPPDRMDDPGVDVDLRVYPASPLGFTWPHPTPMARAALDDIESWLRGRIAAG